MKRTPFRWLDRRIAKPGPRLTLCLDEGEFIAAVKRLKVKSPAEWINAGADATAHYLHLGANQVVIVCLSGWRGRTAIEVAGLLIHEAVHVWQFYARDMGEDAPGSEQEAYAVQAIAQELLAEFARRQA